MENGDLKVVCQLHVSHEEPGQTAQRIDKVKSLLQALTANLQVCYTPIRCLAV